LNITLIRHSEVQKDYIGCYNGHIDIELSQTGHKEAKNLAKKLKHKKYDAIFCSDLKRAKQTLSYFKRKNVIFTKELREKSWGRHEGMSYDEIVKKEGIEYENFLQWIEFLDGESIDEFQARVKNFFFEYLPSLKKDEILVVTHSGVIKTFFAIEKNIPLKEAFALSVPYSSTYILDF